jgi:hypothetical protein
MKFSFFFHIIVFRLNSLNQLIGTESDEMKIKWKFNIER